MYNADKLKAAVSMPQLLETYGFSINRAHKMCCPFHAEKTPSFTVYKDCYHCYGCGAHGDIFSFVMRYYGLTFPQAVVKISNDFGIGVDLDQRRPSEEVERIRREREQKALEKYRNDMEFQRLAEEHRQLRRDLIDYAPRSEYDFVHERYVYALHHADELLDALIEKIWKEGDRNRSTD